MKIINICFNKKHKISETLSLTLILFILSYFLIFSKANYKIMVDSIDIFLKIVIPSLFPFILFSNILIYSNYFNLIASTYISKLIRKFFKTSEFGASAIIFGFLFGYPNGARYVNELYEKKKISFKEAEFLLLFINNSSPAFILSSIGIGMFGNIRIGTFLLVSHIISSVIIGKFFSYRLNINEKESYEHSNKVTYGISFETITKSITKTIYTMCIIFGFMIISIISYNFIIKNLNILIKVNKSTSAILLGLTEITKGLNEISHLNINLNLLLTLVSFVLGFSSLSIILQIFSCVYMNNFRFKNLLKGKLLHGIISGVVTYTLINIPVIYEFLNIPKYVNFNMFSHNYSSLIDISSILTLTIFVLYIFMFFVIIKKKRLKSSL